MRMSLQFHQSVVDEMSYLATSAFGGGRRHAPERGVSDLGGHAVEAAALVLQPCLGEFRRGLEEAQEVEIEVEAPSGPMRCYEPNMTDDFERNEVDGDLRFAVD